MNDRNFIDSIMGMLRHSAEELGADPEKEEISEDGIWRCRKCGGVRLKRIRVSPDGTESWIRLRCRCDEDDTLADLRKQEDEHIRAENAARLMAESGVPKKFRSASLFSIDLKRAPKGMDEAIRCIRMLTDDIPSALDAGLGVYINGPCGVGKSYLAASAANAYCLAGYNALYIRMGELFPHISSTWKQGSAESEYSILQRIEKADVVVFDDFGQDNLNASNGNEGWKRDAVYRIIDTRYAAELPTVFTSNVPIAHLPSRGYPEPVLDRILEMAPLNAVLSGEGYRKAFRSMISDERLK